MQVLQSINANCKLTAFSFSISQLRYDLEMDRESLNEIC